jgi:hypothetical protein
MNWKKERDLLIAQTLAFVQSVSGNKLDIEPKPDFEPKPDLGAKSELLPDVALRVAPAPVAAREYTPEIADPTRNTPGNIHISRTVVPGDIRAEMQNRIADFRAHQERFHRERAEYFSATLAKLRAKMEDDSASLR